jgi:hypothetical protein
MTGGVIMMTETGTAPDGRRATGPMATVNEAIGDYVQRGWSIIPIRPGDKRPLIRWEEFQHGHPDESVALGWFCTCLTLGSVS